MRTNNTFGVQFITRSNKTKNGLYPIYASISVDSHHVEVSLKKFIHPDNWNDAKGSAKGKSEEIRNLNTYLEQIRSRLTECHQELTVKKIGNCSGSQKPVLWFRRKGTLAYVSFRLSQYRDENYPEMGHSQKLFYHPSVC